MTARFALTIVQECLNNIDRCHDGDYSGIYLRLEYLNRIIINTNTLPDSIAAGIGSALSSLSNVCQTNAGYRTERLYTGRRGRPSFQVSEDQLSCLVDSGFTVPQMSILLGVSKRTVGKEDVSVWHQDIR